MESRCADVKTAGESWGSEIMVGRGFQGGGAIVNETNGDILDNTFCPQFIYGINK